VPDQDAVFLRYHGSTALRGTIKKGKKRGPRLIFSPLILPTAFPRLSRNAGGARTRKICPRRRDLSGRVYYRAQSGTETEIRKSKKKKDGMTKDGISSSFHLKKARCASPSRRFDTRQAGNKKEGRKRWSRAGHPGKNACSPSSSLAQRRRPGLRKRAKKEEKEKVGSRWRASCRTTGLPAVRSRFLHERGKKD